MNKSPLTISQQIIYDCIVKYMKNNYDSPTVRELCNMADVSSTSTVNFHLKHLKEKGYINYEPRKKRNITIPDEELEKIY